MKMNPHLFEAFLKCPTKCFLRSTALAGFGNAYAGWVQTQNDAYRNETATRLLNGVPEHDRSSAPPATESLKTAMWRLAVDVASLKREHPYGFKRNTFAIPELDAINKWEKSRKIVLDLKFTGGGVKRWIVRYDFNRYKCLDCTKTFFPQDREWTGGKYGPSLLAYAISPGAAADAGVGE